MNNWKIEDAISDLKTSHARTTKGIWGKGKTTHETVSRNEGRPPYKIADFHHADDAQFIDLAHALLPALIDHLESLEKDAGRYRWLAKEKLHIVPAGMDGPEFPRLVFGFDFHCRTPELHNEEGLSKAIDTAMQSEK